MFNCTPVFQGNYNSTAKVIINQGGVSSSKTVSIMQVLFLKAIYQTGQVITITGESLPNLRKGAYRDAEWLYSITPSLRKAISFWNKSDRIIYFKSGSVMEFISNSDEQGAKAGKRDYLFANEANGIPWSIFFQLAIRTRKQVFIDYNPTAPAWPHDKLIGTLPESNDLSATVQLIISDHRHNPFLSKEEHEKIEGIKDPELWKVYARGMTGNLSGLIYPNWKQIPDLDYPWQGDKKFGGLDFGYTQDPTAGVMMVRIANKIFIHELCYTPGITPVQLKAVFNSNGFDGNTPIYCEHDGDMIRQLRTSGLLAIAARKGPNSINPGILKVNEYDVFYTASSKNIDFERKRYMFMKDPNNGKFINTPVEGDDHLCDAIRYGVYTHFYRAA